MNTVLHCITQKVYNHYAVKCQFCAFNLEKNYVGQKKFTQAPPVVPVTNIRYQWVVSKCLQVNFQGEVTSERIGGLKLKSQVIPILNHLISFPSHCTFHRLQRICIERVVWSSSDEVQLLIAGHWNDLRRDDRLIPRAWTSRRWNRRTLQNTWSLTLELLTHLWWGGSQRRRTLKLSPKVGRKCEC